MITNLRDLMKVDIPDGELDGLIVEKFEIKPNDLTNMRNALNHGRGTNPGWYTRLLDQTTFWMSDTDAERSDHLKVVQRIRDARAERVLITGLGIGMVLKAALAFPHVKRVDVVEIDERVIKLIGPTYTADERVNIIHADAYEQAQRWPKGTRWDVIWDDIWPTIDEKNLEGMAALRRAYARRYGWQGSWGKSAILRLQAADKREMARLALWEQQLNQIHARATMTGENL